MFNEDSTGLTIERTTIELLRNCAPFSVYRVFYDTYIEKRIVSKLLGITYGFGMLHGKDATIPHSHEVDHSMHTIGMLLMEWLREHKQVLTS